MSSTQYNRVMFTANAGGLADFTVGTAVTGYSTPAERGVIDGATVSYAAETVDRSQWETGTGVYTSGTIARTTIRESSSSDAKVNFGAAPRVWLDLHAQDVRRLLTEDTHFYILPTGSDTTGDGTIDNPWQTPQFAYKTICRTIESAGWNVILKYLPGTYTNMPLGIGRGTPLGSSPFDAFLEEDQAGWRQDGNLYISGDYYDPGSVILDNSMIFIGDGSPGTVDVNGFHFKNGNQAIYITGPSLVYVGAHIFENVAHSHVELFYSGMNVDYYGPIEIRGDFLHHITADAVASQVRFFPTLLTFTGAVMAVGGSFLWLRGTGSEVQIDVNGGDPGSIIGAASVVGLKKFTCSVFATINDPYELCPGSVAGTFAQGGQYASTLGNIRSLSSADMHVHNARTYAQLPAASTMSGGVAHITDCSTSSIGATAAGSGANDVLVRSNGTDWLVLGGGSGGGVPAGSSLTLQYNNASSFGGMSGTSWDETNRSLTLTGATVTTSKPVLDLIQTWNNVGVAFTGYKFNVVNSNSLTTSRVLDIQLGGASAFYVAPIPAFPTIPVVIIPNGFQCNGNIGSIDRGVAFGYLGSVADLSFGSDVAIDWCSTTSPVGTVDTSINRRAAGVVGFGTNSTANASAYIQWGGQARVTGDFSKTTDAALANVTGLTVNVKAGRTYSFTADLPYTCVAAGGVQASIAGTATATDIRYNGYIVDSAANGIKGNVQASALGTAVASATTTGTDGLIRITGTITVNAAGTLTVQFAQNTSNGTASVVKRGAFFIVNDMP